jgi:hypothetical protein
LAQVEFGQLYYGESTTREVVLVNTGPAEAKFDLSFGAAADMQAFAAEANAGGDSTTNFLAVARVRVSGSSLEAPQAAQCGRPSLLSLLQAWLW